MVLKPWWFLNTDFYGSFPRFGLVFIILFGEIPDSPMLYSMCNIFLQKKVKTVQYMLEVICNDQVHHVILYLQFIHVSQLDRWKLENSKHIEECDSSVFF